MADAASVSVIFNEDWYRNGGPAFEGPALEHFQTTGWRAGRDPHPLFNVDFYLAQAPELLESDVDPVSHYLDFGASAGLDPHPLFDTAYYERSYPATFATMNPLVHFLSNDRQTYNPNLYFAAEYYLERFPDVAKAGENPLVHYAVNGGREPDRQPHPLFDAAAYIRRRKLATGINPLVDFRSRLRTVRTRIAKPVGRPDVSIVVLNLNKSLLTLACIVEIAETAPGLSYEIIVVDNGSDPRDFAHLADHLPQSVTLIRLSANRYFGEGNNIGAEAARGRFILFLNNDAFVEADTLALLVAAMERYPDAGAVGPKFVYADGRLQEAGGFVMSCGSVVQRGKLLDDLPGRFATDLAVSYVSAACVLIRRDLFDAVGGFDLTWEPAYYEDIDLCLRLALLEKKTYYIAAARVTHIENATSSDQSHGLRLSNAVALNREKFVARWGDYLEGGNDASLARVALPAPQRRPASVRGKRAIVYTPYPLIPGGGERYLLSIARDLSRSYETVLMTPDRYSAYRLRGIAADLDLDLAEVRMEVAGANAGGHACDLLVALGNEILPPIPAIGERSIYVCQFPFPMHPNHVASAWGRLDAYDDIVMYSEFAAAQYRERSMNVVDRIPPITVIAPACPMYDANAGAERVAGRILNVGRFTLGGHCKRQDEIVDAFALLVRSSGRTDLELHLAGTVSADASSRDYYFDVHRRAAGLPVFFYPNATASVMRHLYATSAHYWHATGYGQSGVLHPERLEHFGISVVEAMSAGAIPFVYAAGGPAEIVRDGQTGFHWRTLEALVAANLDAFALAPAEADAMRRRSHAAARAYDDAAFDRRLQALLARAPRTADSNGRAVAGAVR